MTKKILQFLDYQNIDIENKTKAFQEYDEATLAKSFDFFEEESDLINLARQAKGELEALLQNS